MIFEYLFYNKLHMNYKIIGENKVSRLILGCWRFGSLSVEEMETLIRVSLENGITMFDHACTYERGKSEHIFGEVLKKYPDLRKQMYIQSKCGIVKDKILYYDFSKNNIITCVKESIERLQCGYLDYLLLHRPDTLMNPREVAEALNYLYEEGLVHRFGVSNMVALQIENIQKYMKQKLIINQLQFNPVNTRILDETVFMNTPTSLSLSHSGYILEYMRLHDMTLQAWSILQIDREEGCLIGHPKYSKLNTCLEHYAQKFKVSISAVIIAWILYHPIEMQAIIGSRQPKRIKEACEFEKVILSKMDWYQIYEAGIQRKLQ